MKLFAQAPLDFGKFLLAHNILCLQIPVLAIIAVIVKLTRHDLFLFISPFGVPEIPGSNASAKPTSPHHFTAGGLAVGCVWVIQQPGKAFALQMFWLIQAGKVAKGRVKVEKLRWLTG